MQGDVLGSRRKQNLPRAVTRPGTAPQPPEDELASRGQLQSRTWFLALALRRRDTVPLRISPVYRPLLAVLRCLAEQPQTLS